MVATQKIHTGKSVIHIDEEGILRLTAVPGVEIDLEEVTRCFDIYEQLGCRENKTLQLIDTRGDGSMTPEARNYAAQHVDKFFIASAVVSDSLAVRMLVNFFNGFYRQRVPLRMFKTEEDALQWLRKFRK